MIYAISSFCLLLGVAAYLLQKRLFLELVIIFVPILYVRLLHPEPPNFLFRRVHAVYLLLPFAKASLRTGLCYDLGAFFSRRVGIFIGSFV